MSVVLGGGAWAASTGGFHSVGHKQLRPDAVDSRRVENGTLRRADLAPGMLPVGANGDLQWYIGVQRQGVISLPRDPVEVASVKVPEGRYFITASANLFNTEDTGPDDLLPLVDCTLPGASYSETLPADHGSRVLSFSAISFISEGDKIDLRCDARSQVEVKVANTQVDAIFLGSH